MAVVSNPYGGTPPQAGGGVQPPAVAGPPPAQMDWDVAIPTLGAPSATSSSALPAGIPDVLSKLGPLGDIIESAISGHFGQPSSASPLPFADSLQYQPPGGSPPPAGGVPIPGKYPASQTEQNPYQFFNPVNYDPFSTGSPSMTPVDHDPFAGASGNFPTGGASTLYQ